MASIYQLSQNNRQRPATVRQNISGVAMRLKMHICYGNQINTCNRAIVDERKFGGVTVLMER